MGGETLAALRCPYAGNAASRCRGPVITAGLEGVLIHFGRAIRQGRKVDLSLKKMDDRD
jgi:acyl-CoA hydrolase